MSILALAVVMLGASACQNSQTQAGHVSLPATWLGASQQALAEQWGEPHQRLLNERNESVLVYRRMTLYRNLEGEARATADERNSNDIAPSRIQVVRIGCDFAFSIGDDQRVRAWDMAGSGCGYVLSESQPLFANRPAIDVPGPEWRTINAAPAGFSDAGLDRLFEFAGQRNSTELFISVDGRVVREQRWPGGDAPSDVASVQKSVLSLLLMMAHDRGLLEFNKAVSDYLNAGWSKATPEQEAQIKVTHLLTMTSGLTSELTHEAAPGDRWRYNTPAYHELKRVLQAAAAMTLQDITQQWLIQPLGLTASSWQTRANMTLPSGQPAGAWFSTGSDMARIGLLMLNLGRWNGPQLIHKQPAFVVSLITPSNSHNPSYGMLWWLNYAQAHLDARSGVLQQGRPWPSAPDDLFAARGAGGQAIYVVPSLRMVIARRGRNPGADFDEAFWQLLTAARQNAEP